MQQGFQKSANPLRELCIPHPGIIEEQDFAQHFSLRCYEPSSNLQPFVTHLWVQRLIQPFAAQAKPPVELAPGPHVYLFFTSDSAYIHGITRQPFAYDARASRVVAGVKFRPGGFYPFMRRAVSSLGATAPITTVFPAADETFRKKLLEQSDEIIVPMLEALLRMQQPQHTKDIDRVATIIEVLGSDTSLRTVSATARMFGMSERSLQLLFQTYVGTSVKQIISRRRLLEAVSHIKSQPHRTWAATAIELGYNSQSHFSRDFRQIIGLTPSEYIQKLHQRYDAS